MSFAATITIEWMLSGFVNGIKEPIHSGLSLHVGGMNGRLVLVFITGILGCNSIFMQDDEFAADVSCCPELDHRCQNRCGHLNQY